MSTPEEDGAAEHTPSCRLFGSCVETGESLIRDRFAKKVDEDPQALQCWRDHWNTILDASVAKVSGALREGLIPSGPLSLETIALIRLTYDKIYVNGDNRAPVYTLYHPHKGPAELHWQTEHGKLPLLLLMGYSSDLENGKKRAESV